MNFLLDGLGVPVLSLLFLFFGVTAVLWLLLPFSIFGIKSKLEEQLRVLRSMDARLERLERLRQTRTTRRARPQPPSGGRDEVETAHPVPGDDPHEAVLNDEIPGSGDLPIRDGGDTRWQKPAAEDGG